MTYICIFIGNTMGP